MKNLYLTKGIIILKYSLVLFLTFVSLSAISQEKLYFADDFIDNQNDWSLGSTTEYSKNIEEGCFNLELFSADAGRWGFYKSIYFNPDKDFMIETSIKQVSGVADYGYGLIFGGNNINNQYSFVISTNGYFKISKYLNGESEENTKWSKIDNINAVGTYNKLQIQRKNEDLIFKVNDIEIYKTTPLNFLGFKIGFEISKQMKISIDYLKIYQDLNINLVKNLTTGLIKENLGDKINSIYSEINPQISPDGKTLYFVVKDDPNNVGKTINDDIYYSTIQDDGTWSQRKNIGFPLNNDSHNSVISISPDNNSLFLLNTYYDDGSNRGDGFSTTERTANGWSMPKKVYVRNYYNKNKYVEACMSADKKVLLFTIQRDDSFGEKDIYVSLLDNGIWAEPKNLGPVINSLGSEVSPFIAADGVSLYFSSNGHPGYGDNDMFVSRRLDDTWTNWSEPENLGNEINSPNFDAYYTIPASGKYAYMVSSVSGNKDDIFRISLPESAKPNPVILVYGKVLNSKTNEPLQAKISYKELSTDKELGIAESNIIDGSYKIILPLGKNYSFLAYKSDFISVNENMDVTKLENYKEIEKNLYLSPIEVGMTVRLNNIFFDFAKATLRNESFPELDRVVKLLTDNPNMNIEISGHTDNVGADEVNLKLSQERADAVKNYIVTHNIANKRIESKGYGKNKPSTNNDTEENRQLNRRVEFTILKK